MQSFQIRTESKNPSSPIFPPAWQWLVDEAIPSWVKQNYSPRESWKDKPFAAPDAHFFFKGIEELSELFTEDRPKDLPAYFNHPKYRSSYLLYFLPLQAAKFLTLFQLHPGALQAALKTAGKTGVLRVADLGSGPGTASLALLLWLLQPGTEVPEKIEFDWFDTHRGVMEDGQALVEYLASHFPKLRGKVTLRTHTTPWWKAPSLLKSDPNLVLVGHVLNESTPNTSEHTLLLPKSSKPTLGELEEEDEDETQAPADPSVLPLAQLARRVKGGGILLVEPAARRASQYLSQLRNQLISTQAIEQDPSAIWGPCLHAGNCPLAHGRDWCHLSVPAEIPGRWFKMFSEGLGSERQWLKFSYLWLAAPGSPSKTLDKTFRRVISDPLRQIIPGQRQAPGPVDVLICEPDTPNRWKVPASAKIFRGDLIQLRPGLGLRPNPERAPGDKRKKNRKPRPRN